MSEKSYANLPYDKTLQMEKRRKEQQMVEAHISPTSSGGTEDGLRLALPEKSRSTFSKTESSSSYSYRGEEKKKRGGLKRTPPRSGTAAGTSNASGEESRKADVRRLRKRLSLIKRKERAFKPQCRAERGGGKLKLTSNSARRDKGGGAAWCSKSNILLGEVWGRKKMGMNFIEERRGEQKKGKKFATTGLHFL